MDPDPPPPAPRKVRYAPKKPPRKTPKLVAAKIEPEIEDSYDAAVAQAEQEALSRKLNEHLTRRGPKVEKKSSVRVAFSHGAAASEIRTFGNQREGTSSRSNATDLEDMDLDDWQKKVVTSTSTDGIKGSEDFTGLTNPLSVKKKKEYREPWDCHNSYYPTTLPWRRPFSGDPGRLDKEEFENAVEYNENTIHSASDLGLLDQDNAPKMLFLQFPTNLSLGKPPTSANTSADKMKEVISNMKEIVCTSTVAKGKEIVGTSTVAKGKEILGTSTVAKGKEIARSSVNPPVKGYPSKGVGSLEELPEGYMGKMLVYKSGAVKLKLGDILYDVSPGSDCMFAQNVAAINTTANHYVELGEVNKRAIVTPDIDSLIDNVIDLG